MSDAAARATEARTAPSTAPDRAGWLLALAGLAMVAAGVVQHRLWQELPVPRLLEGLALLLGLVALALPIAWLWRRSLALCLLLATGLVTLQLLGPRTVLAAALLGLAAASLGRRIGGASGIPGTARLGAGLAGLAAIVGWTLPFPVHSPLTHALLCLGLIALGGRGLGRDLHAAVDALDREARRAPWAAMLACAALALTASHAWLPTLLFDDLAYHLGLPSQLARLHYYRMDAASQAWALAPWLGDSLFASARLLAGQDARGALNLLWLGLATSALHRLTRSFAPQRPAAPWLAVASFASLPVVAVLVAGMQVELILMALLLALLDLWRSHPSNGDPAPRGRTLACLVGGLLATKLSTLPVLLLIACHALWRRRGRLDPRTLLGPALLVALVGGSAYTYAAWLAGNPVLPLANDVFQSRFFSPAAFSDARYPSGISLPLLWDWAFASRQVYESWNGVSGFQWLALGGLGLLALRGRRALTALGALGLAWFLIQFQLMAYLRYLTPPLVLLLPALAIAASERARPLGAVLAVLAVAGNLAMQANANWLLRDFGVADILRAKGETEQLVARVAPELPLIERARARTARPRILLADPERPFAAACGGCAFVRNWYDHELKARLAGDEPDALRRALQPLGFSHVILHRGSASASAFEPALEALGAVPIAHLNGAELWELPPAPPTATDLFEQRDLARQHVHRPRPPSSTGNP